jgi:23S rRNA (adenine2503-C2)-methyltransferase
LSSRNGWQYVFEKDNAVAEAVLYKYPTFEQRTVVCCSTQSGCPIGCRFCGAGDSFVRSLSADEIVSQTQHLFFDKKINTDIVDKMQIMFMSMGEPLLNLKELDTAIRRLNVLYPKAALLISTSAPEVDYKPLVELSKDISKVGLQFSVHESTDEARNNLIPFKKKLSLAEIAEVGSYWAQQVGRQPFFNYCAHEKNSSIEDADRLAKLFDPSIWQATISVICEREETIAAANIRQRKLASDFQSLLLERGFSTRMFDPAGQDDIGGGCGQLWFVQEWMRNNPELAKPSIGRKLPVIHTPK